MIQELNSHGKLDILKKIMIFQKEIQKQKKRKTYLGDFLDLDIEHKKNESKRKGCVYHYREFEKHKMFDNISKWFDSQVEFPCLSYF